MKRTTIAAGLAAAALSIGLAGCGSSAGSAPPTQPAGTTSLAATSPATTAPAATTPAAKTAINPPTTTVSGASATAGPGLSRFELAEKAGVICTAATVEGRKITAPADLTSSAHAAAAYFNKAVPPLDAETRALQALKPSAAMSAEWESVLGAQVALDSLADEYRQKADAGVKTSLADISQLSTVGQTLASAAIRIGVRCD